jgi:hypothetical protein
MNEAEDDAHAREDGANAAEPDGNALMFERFAWHRRGRVESSDGFLDRHSDKLTHQIEQNDSIFE